MTHNPAAGTAAAIARARHKCRVHRYSRKPICAAPVRAAVTSTSGFSKSKFSSQTSPALGVAASTQKCRNFYGLRPQIVNIAQFDGRMRSRQPWAARRRGRAYSRTVYLLANGWSRREGHAGETVLRWARFTHPWGRPLLTATRFDSPASETPAATCELASNVTRCNTMRIHRHFCPFVPDAARRRSTAPKRPTT